MKSVAETTRRWAEQREIALRYMEQTGSTNDDAKRSALREADEAVLYLAAHQTAGRGRGTNTWLDTGSGDGLLSTWSFAMPAAPQAITGPRVGLSLFRAANAVWPSLAWSLKAPNDLYLSGLKAGGLLVETVTDGSRHRLLIGLGINVLNHPRRFMTAEHISKAAGSVEESEMFQFLDELLAEFTSLRAEIAQAKLLPEVCRALCDALNANPARAFLIQQVSPHGDLLHAHGQVRWTDL